MRTSEAVQKMREEKREKRRKTLEEAYALLENVTPERYDCGELCGQRCCHDNNVFDVQASETGMVLLPGEKELLFREGYMMRPSTEGLLMVCNGYCRRVARPFACRIFPYYPKITREGKKDIIEILPDPRAQLICPILWETRRRKVTVRFLRAAKKATRVLLRDKEIAIALRKHSELVSEIAELRERLLKVDASASSTAVCRDTIDQATHE